MITLTETEFKNISPLRMYQLTMEELLRDPTLNQIELVVILDTPLKQIEVEGTLQLD